MGPATPGPSVVQRVPERRMATTFGFALVQVTVLEFDYDPSKAASCVEALREAPLEVPLSLT